MHARVCVGACLRSRVLGRVGRCQSLEDMRLPPSCYFWGPLDDIIAQGLGCWRPKRRWLSIEIGPLITASMVCATQSPNPQPVAHAYALPWQWHQLLKESIHGLSNQGSCSVQGVHPLPIAPIPPSACFGQQRKDDGRVPMGLTRWYFWPEGSLRGMAWPHNHRPCARPTRAEGCVWCKWRTRAWDLASILLCSRGTYGGMFLRELVCMRVSALHACTCVSQSGSEATCFACASI